MKFAAGLAIALALMAAPAAAQSKDEPGITKLRAAFQAAVGAQNGPAIAKLFTPDGVEMPPNVPAQMGRAAIEAYHKAFGQQWMMHGITLTPRTLQVWNGDTAYEIGAYTQQLMSQKDGSIFDDKGKYIVLMKKEPTTGNWLISHTMYNSDVPPPAPKK